MHLKLGFQFLYYVPFFKYAPTPPVVSSTQYIYIWTKKQNFLEIQPPAPPNHQKTNNQIVGIPVRRVKFCRDLS